MKLILKYLKPYVWIVVLIFGLTFAQVQTELALPDYMSDIVTNGIQYGGIVEDLPKAISKDDYDLLSNFLNVEDKTIFGQNYTLIKKGSKAVLSNQEILFNDDVYYLKEDYDPSLANILQKPLVYCYSIKSSGLDITDINAATSVLDNSLIGLEDNFKSMAKLEIQSMYKNVGVNTVTLQTNYILHTGLLMLGISLISVLVTIASTYFATNIATKVAAKIRSDIFEKVESFSNSEFSTFSTSSLITRTSNDITKIQQLIQMMLRMMLMAPLMGLTSIFKVAKYPGISWLLLVAIGVILATLITLLIVAVPKFEVIQKLVDKINNIMRERLDGTLVIRAFNSQKIEEDKFDKANIEQTSIDRFISRCLGTVGPIMTVTMNLLTVMITWFAAKQIDIDAMTIGDMMAFIQYAMHVVMSFMFVSVTFFMVPRSLVSAKRIAEVLDTPLSILDKEEVKVLPLENGNLCFENVCFKYPGAGENVLENISFEAQPGQTIAFIGSTGSGKSTLIKLIPRLFDVSQGRITYCGIDIRDVGQKELRKRIGFASQKATLFTGTIRSNIEFGRELSEEEINTAIKVSQSTNIIAEKEKGLAETINQGGTNVSGGQKQRLSIARALAKKANIYIFDDCFSALDYETDKKLRNDLNALIEKTKATVIIVAQRISTIKNADKIIVLEEGKIVGVGKHKELLNNCSVYQEIASSQLTKEELENARA